MCSGMRIALFVSKRWSRRDGIRGGESHGTWTGHIGGDDRAHCSRGLSPDLA